MDPGRTNDREGSSINKLILNLAETSSMMRLWCLRTVLEDSEAIVSTKSEASIRELFILGRVDT